MLRTVLFGLFLRLSLSQGWRLGAADRMRTAQAATHSAGRHDSTITGTWGMTVNVFEC